MAARKTSPKARAAGAGTTPQPVPSDTGRQQLAVASEGTDAMLRGFEAIRLINDRAVQAALARFATAAGKYQAPREPLDLLAIPTELVRSQMEGVASYWQELSGATLEMQAELLGCSSRLVDSDALLQTAAALDALPAFPGLGLERLFAGGGAGAKAVG